jgi:hypothetical protein
LSWQNRYLCFKDEFLDKDIRDIDKYLKKVRNI